MQSNNIAEIQVGRQGLMLAWDKRFIFINLGIDSTTIINWLTINRCCFLNFLLQEPYETSIYHKALDVWTRQQKGMANTKAFWKFI